MREIEQTKNSLKTGDMDVSVKREMLDKFKQMGGKVYSDKTSDNNKGSKSRTSVISRGSSQNSSNKEAVSTESKRQLLIDMHKSESETFLNRLFVKIKAKLGSVSNFKGDVSVNFVKQVNNELGKTFLDLRLMQKVINPKAMDLIKDEIPIHKFIFQQIFSLYQLDIFQDIQHQLKFSVGSYTASSYYKKSFYYIFKRLYLLYTYKKTVDRLLVIITKNIQDDKAKIIYRHIRRDFNKLYTYYFEKLYLFVISAEKRNIPIISILMEDTLSITEEEKTEGFEAKPDDTEEEGLEEEDDDSEDEIEEEKDLGDSIKNEFLERGLELINSKDISLKKTNFLLKKEMENFHDDDINYIIYLTFKEFDMEYSPILTTSQIQIDKKLELESKNMTYSDFLNSIYDSLLSISKEFEKYNQAKDDYAEFQKTKPPNYIIAAKNESEFSSKLSNRALGFRLALKKILEDVIFVFERLINNMNDHETDEKIVLNPSDIVDIESINDSTLPQKSVKDAIGDTYSFCVAFLHKIENNQF